MSEHDKLLDQTARQIEKLTAEAFAELMRRIRAGEDPQSAIQAIMQTWEPAYRERLAEAFSATLARFVGPDELRDYPIGEMALSPRLYAHAATNTAVVRDIVQRHAAGFQDARQLTLQLFEGYGFRKDEPLKISPKNPKLPKYLRREILTDPDLAGQLARHFTKVQAATLKTPALRAAYLEAIDAMEKGRGSKALERKLEVAYQERMRYHANRIAQTELHRAWMDKQAEELMADDTVEVVQFKMSGTHPRTDICDLFAKQDAYGLGPGLYPKEHAPRPPLHPHCLPGDALITASGRITAVTKRWFNGNVAVITTASGKRLTATVNHPVLTSRGWVGAGLLDVGDKVVSRVDAVGVGGNAVVHDQHYDMPTRISEIADAFFGSSEVAAREVPMSAEDFHGDGVAGEVAVIGADCKLWDRIDTATSEVGHHHFLNLANAAATGLLGDGGFDEVLETTLGSASSLMRGSSKSRSFRIGKPGHPDFVGITSPASDNASLVQSIGDYASADADLARQIQNGTTGEVFFDDVIHVDRDVVFAGHVYNLETEHGHYTSNGIVTHNCRCGLISKRLISAKGAQFKPEAHRVYLRQVMAEEGVSKAAQVVGSRAKLQAVLRGAEPLTVVNAGRPAAYHLRMLSDPYALPSLGTLPERTEWRGDETVGIVASESTVKKHPFYGEAKTGGTVAATRLVMDILDDAWLAIHGRSIQNSTPILVGVHAVEGMSTNVIGPMLSQWLGMRLDLPVDDNIVQINRVGHTGSSGWHRLATPALFAGAVMPGRTYWLADDFVGQGGTLANLRGYIESKGGRVVGYTALTGRPDSSVLGLNQTTLSALRKKHGTLENWWQQQFGFGFDRLTESEARYLLRAEDADTIRNRLASGR